MPVSVRVSGGLLSAVVGKVSLDARDDSDTAFVNGGIGLVIHEGALSADYVTISAT